MDPDDVSAIVAFDSRIGVMWSSQYDESGWAGYHFATHKDGDPDDEWSSDNPILDPHMSNDHINLKADSEGRIFAVTKTRYDRLDRDLNAPYIVLWVRELDGTWTSHPFGTVSDSHTRAFPIIDEERRDLYVFASSPTCTGGKIYYKRTSLDDVSFGEGRGTPFMEDPDGTNIHDPTSTKQNLEEVSGLMVVASSPSDQDPSGNYYYNLLDPRSQEKLHPDRAQIANAGYQ